MALLVGELFAKLRADNAELKKGLDDGERDFKKFGDRVAGLAAVAGAAAALAFGVALVGAMSAQDVGAKVSAQLGGTTEDAAAWGKLAGDIYSANFGESLSAVGDAISEIEKMDLAPSGTDEELRKITEEALTLSSALGIDVTESAQAAQQMIRNGLAKDATEAFDILTTGMQQGIDKSGDLLDTFNEYPTEFRALGLSGQQAMGLLGQGLKAGARDADTVADSLKEFAIRSKDGSDTTAQGFAAIGLSGAKMTKIFAAGGPQAAAALGTVITKLRDMHDPAARNAAAVALFGTKAEDLQDALFALDPSTAAASLGEVTGATDKMSATMGATAGSNLESFKRQIETTFTNVVGGKAIPLVTGLATTLSTVFSPALQSAGGWIQRNHEWLAPLAVMVGTFGGIIGVVVGAVKLWEMATAAYTVVQWAMNTAMLANPIGLIIIGIVALVAGLIYAYKHSEAFRHAVDATWRGIKAAVSAVVNWLTGTAWPWIKGVWDSVSGSADKMGRDIKAVFDVVAGHVAFVVNIISSIAHVWLWVAGVVMGYVTGQIRGYMALIGALFSWLYITFVAPGVAVVKGALDMLGGAFMWLYAGYIKPAFDLIGGYFSWLWGMATSIFGKIIGVAERVGGAFSRIFGAIGGYISNAFNGAVGVVKGAINSLVSLVNSAIGFLNSSVIGKLNALPGVHFPMLSAVPHLASGGVVHPTTGGRPVVMGDGGQVEYGVPHSEMQAIIASAVAAGAGSGTGGGVLTVHFRGDGILRGIRGTTRVQGGDASTVLVGA